MSKGYQAYADALTTSRDSGDNSAVLQHIGLVHKTALHIKARLPDYVELEELVQIGMVGLLEAAKSYDASQGADLGTFASKRIRGAILDEVRKRSPLSRADNSHIKAEEQVVDKFLTKYGRQPTAHEIAQELDTSVDEYHKQRSRSQKFRTSSLDELDNYEKMKSKVGEELKRYFRPEFLNRIDETIVFHELTVDEVKEIVDLMLDRVHNQLKNSDLEIVLSDEAKEFLATEGYDKEFGARPLRRSIQRLLEDPLSEELLQGKYKAGSTIIISLNKEDNTLEFESVEAPDEPPVDFVESES